MSIQAFSGERLSAAESTQKVTWQHYQESEAIAVLGHLMKSF